MQSVCFTHTGWHCVLWGRARFRLCSVLGFQQVVERHRTVITRPNHTAVFVKRVRSRFIWLVFMCVIWPPGKSNFWNAESAVFKQNVNLNLASFVSRYLIMGEKCHVVYTFTSHEPDTHTHRNMDLNPSGKDENPQGCQIGCTVTTRSTFFLYCNSTWK